MDPYRIGFDIPKIMKMVDTICKILDLSLGGVSRKDIYPLSKLYLGLSSKEVDRYLCLISAKGFAYVTENHCEPTYVGACLMQEFPELVNFLKVNQINESFFNKNKNEFPD